jgi:transcriptional regulator with XRE-family HTH domain
MPEKKFPNEKILIEARKTLLKYLQQIADEKKITHQQIADLTGFKRNNVGRMLAGHYSPSLDNFMKLAQAVGCYFFVAEKESGSELTTTMRINLVIPAKRKCNKNFR